MSADALVFIDTETTSLDPATGRIWELAMISRRPGGREDVLHVIVDDVDLAHASPEALEVGRFAERHARRGMHETVHRMTESEMVGAVAMQLNRLPARAVLVGSNAAFDAAFLEQAFRRHGALPVWWHHQLNLVAVGLGILLEQGEELALPCSSYAMSRRFGVEPPRVPEAHTALGDARWHQAWWNAMAGEARS